MSRRKAPPKTGLDAEPLCVRRIVLRLMFGETLMKQHRITGTNDKITEYRWLPSGKSCARSSAEKAISSGYVMPTSGGLFGDDNAQTYGARP